MRKAVLLLALAGTGCHDTDTMPLSLIVPRELADAAALEELSDWMSLPVFGEGTYRMQSSEDRKTGWQPPIALWKNDNRDFNNFVCRGAETEAATPQVPYVFDLDRCPEPYVRGMVMARFEGTGRLARIWMTAASIRADTPDDEVIRIYVDDDPSPRVQAPLAEMLAGGGHEVFAPPFGAGSRRYLSWHYPVVFDGKLIVTIDRLGQRDLYFHQTSVVLEGEHRVAPPRRLAERTTAKRFLSSSAPPSGRTVRSTIALEPKQARQLGLSGPATIVRTELTRATDPEAIQLQVFWDDDAAPAFDVPLSAMFAMWSSPPTRPSMALAGKSLRLPMPFASRAIWRLQNTSDRPVEVVLTHELVGGVPTQPWGHLHVQSNTTTGAARGKTHPLAKASGRGRLVGTCMSMRGHGLVERGQAGHPFHFLEGDELGLVDGERVLAGTGTEDYFDGAFYFEQGPIGTPFSQVWDITPRIPDDPRQGRVSTCRWHVLGDVIDFRQSLDLSLEIGPGVPDVLDDYRSVTFLYH